MEKNIQNVNIYKVKEIAAGLFGEPGNGQKVGPRAGIVVHVYTEKQIKEAQSNAVKRIIVGIITMFVPTIVNLILDLMGKGLDTCGIK